MRPIRKILVAVKETRGKVPPAALKAAGIARALDAQLVLFHAIDDPLVIDVLALGNQSLEALENQARKRYLDQLEKMAAPLRRNGLEVDIAAEWDHPAHEAVVRHARRIHADLVVAERHVSRHVAPWFLRYTDWELLRQSPVPVLLVKSPRPYRSPKVLAAIDPAHAFAKQTKLDDDILKTAARVTSALRGEVHTIHAYVPTILGLDPAELADADATGRIAGDAEALAKTRLEKALRGARVKVSPRQRHLVARHAVDAIPDLARDLKCDIVVMGALSRSGFKRLVIGNTAERLLDDLPCDVLVIKPAAFATRVATRSRGPHLVTLTALSGAP